jgi:hypothetical protein
VAQVVISIANQKGEVRENYDEVMGEVMIKPKMGRISALLKRNFRLKLIIAHSSCILRGTISSLL